METKYEIAIYEIVQSDVAKTYPQKNCIYEQRVSKIDIPAIVKVVNEIK